VVQLLGATSDAAIKFAEDIFEYEKRIARITPNPGNLTDPVANLHIIAVSELKSKSNTVSRRGGRRVHFGLSRKTFLHTCLLLPGLNGV